MSDVILREEHTTTGGLRIETVWLCQPPAKGSYFAVTDETWAEKGKDWHERTVRAWEPRKPDREYRP